MAISLYKVAKFFMLPTGVWKIPISENKLIQKLYTIYSVLIQIVYITYNISMMIRLKQMWGQYKMSELYVFLTLTILIMEINYKIMIFIKNGIPQMFYTLVETEEKILKSGNKDIFEIYLGQVKYYKLATFCQCFCSGFGISWFTAINLYTKYFGVNEHFMYELWFPFKKEEHDLLVTLYNIFIAYYGFLFNCASQTPLQSLMVFSTSQLQILQLNIRKCFDEKNDNEEVKKSKLFELIRQHQFLIKFVTDLNEKIKTTILLEFAIESVHGAGALLQLFSVKKLIEVPYALMYLSLLTINMGALAWSANEVILQSGNIANAIYESNWPDQSETIKKLLFIMLMRAQKPLSIDVGPFRPMNTEAALLTAKGAYTYTQFMRQSRSRDK